MTRRSLPIIVAIFSSLLCYQNCSDVGFDGATFSSSNVNLPDGGGTTKPPLPPVGPPITCRPTTAPELKPKLMWDWKSQLPLAASPRYETFDQVMSSPMVADLNRDGFPEVIFVTWSPRNEDSYAGSTSGANHSRNGVLRIVDGRTGNTKVSVGSTQLAPVGDVSPLLIDLDGDGYIEIVYPHYTYQKLVALNFDGSARWVHPFAHLIGVASTGLSGVPSTTTGRSDVLIGPYIVSEGPGRVPYVRAKLYIANVAHLSPFAAPLNPGAPSTWSVVNHTGIFDLNGALKGSAFAQSIGFTVAADIDPAYPGLEIIGVGSQVLYIMNGQTGAQIRAVNLAAYNDLLCPSGAVGGGPPSVGDFDGDGTALEIAIATGRHLTIFSNMGVPKYKTISQDCSSLSTGLTSFDLNGDKKPEVIYADEEYLRIYEVRNGVLIEAQKIVNPSGTLNEYPIVADITGTGHAALVVAANNYAIGSFYQDAGESADRAVAAAITGVRAFSSTGTNAWMPTKPIWNQHTFHPDFVNNSAQFLKTTVLNANLFRRNTQGANQRTLCTPL